MHLTAETLRSMPRDQVEAAIRSLSPRQAELLQWDWHFWRLPHQVIEPGHWRWWILKGGRGGGKTRTGAETSIERAREPEACGGQMLIAGRTASDVRDIVVDGQSGILRRSPPWFFPKYEPSKQRITWPTFNALGQANYKDGVIANLRSGEEPDGFRGLQWGWAWLDEYFHWTDPERALYEGLEPAGRLGVNPQGLITATPRGSKIARELCRREDVVVRGFSTYDNKANLPDAFIRAIRAKYDGTRLGRQEILGEILDDNPAALWRQEQIDRLRLSAAPTLPMIVVAVDPATTYGEDSDETGIVAAGLGEDKHGYNLADESCRDKPEVWAKRAVDLYRRVRANRIVAESNQGGEMVRHVIHTVDPNVPVKLIHAKAGKRVRAEPVAALYEQGRIHHVGTFEKLEDQMVSVEPGGKDHDDRIDALVHAFTELMVQPAPDLAAYANAWAS